MLDYKNIIIKRYTLNLSFKELAEEFGASKSGVNDFIRAFEKCDKLSYPLPEGITNYAISELVYGHVPGSNNRSSEYEQPDFEWVFRQMNERKNMTLTYLWNRYQKDCRAKEAKPYQYRQFCELYNKWCEENYETLHIPAVIGQKMEVDFAGKTFELIDKISGEITSIVVFVAVLPYSQYIYAEGMSSTREPQWIDVNNHALKYFGGVPAIVVCDNCKQAVLTNRDWIDPDLNKDYAEWADHNHTVILPAKVRKPRYKNSVENAVGILEKGFFHDLEDNCYFSLEQFNRDLWKKLDALNHENFKKKDYSRYDKWEEERHELMPLPSMQYQYMERKTAKVSGDFHVRFDNAYYSVDKAFLHKSVMIAATADTVNIYSLNFRGIRQPDIREEVKKAIYHHLKTEALGSIKRELSAMNKFSKYLDEKHSKISTCEEIDREIIEQFLINIKVESNGGNGIRDDLLKLRNVLETIGKIYDFPHLTKLFLKSDFPPERKAEFKSYSDSELKRLNAQIVKMEEQIARAMIIHQMLGTRISDTLTLRKDCLYKHDRQDMIIIYQPKTRRYEKPISRELAQLIGKAVSYANEHYPESIYIFADENKPERPISYQTLQDKVLRMIYEKDIRDDSGNLFGFGTHMFRHCYGVKLTELHVDDWTIAKLLGHKGVRSVQYYRKMSNQRMADETREVRNFMSQIILASLDGWGEEYEQIRQDAGIE